MNKRGLPVTPPYSVVANLYRGPLPDKPLLDELQQLGVTRLVSLCDESDASMSMSLECARRGLDHCHIPLSPFVRPTEEEIEAFLSLLDQRDGMPTYVHCIHGRDRTGTMLGIFRLSQGWTLADALSEMQSYGFYMGFQELLSALRSYRAP